MDQELYIYIEDKYSKGSLLSSLVIPPLYEISLLRDLLFVRSFVIVTSGCYNIADNYSKVRGHSLTPSRQQSRIASMFSSVYLVDYASRYKHMNDFIEDEQAKNLINSLQLSYASLKK